MVINLTDTDYSTEVQNVVDALNAVYENKQANKKDTLSGDYSSDTASYPTCKAVKAAYGTKVTSWSSTVSDSNVPSEKLVKDALDGKQAAGSYAPATHTHATGDVTNSATLSNISSSALSTQSDINSALNTVIGVLKGTKVIEIENKPSTATADTMGKLYIVTENSKVNVYYTKQTGTGSGATYSWEKLDANILDDIDDATQSVHGFMSTTDKIKIDKSQVVKIIELPIDSVGENTINFSIPDTSLASGSIFVGIPNSDAQSYINALFETVRNYNVCLDIDSTYLTRYALDAKVEDISNRYSLFYLKTVNSTNVAYLLNKEGSDVTKSEVINEVKVFAGQLAEAINPSS